MLLSVQRISLPATGSGPACGASAQRAEARASLRRKPAGRRRLAKATGKATMSFAVTARALTTPRTALPASARTLCPSTMQHAEAAVGSMATAACTCIAPLSPPGSLSLSCVGVPRVVSKMNPNKHSLV